MSFPQELTALRQWICWRLEPDPRGEKPRKVPYDPKTGRKASSTNPETWATLPEAMRAQTKYLFTGVGFVFTEAGGIVGVDIDHCRKENGTFTEAAQAILDKYPSYTEISPSGAGLHIFYRGVMPGKGNKNSATGVEMAAVNAELDAQYDKEYAVIQLIKDSAERQSALDALNARYNENRLAAAREYAQRVAHPFSGKLVCARCGKHYRRRHNSGKIAWQCSTYMIRGRDYCAAKQIREEIMESVCAQALGLRAFDAATFEAQVERIDVCEDNLLRFHFCDGRVEEYLWRDPSRRDSWTEDMRLRAAEHARKRHVKEGGEQ